MVCFRFLLRKASQWIDDNNAYSFGQRYSIENNSVLMQTCKDKTRDGYYRFVDFIDLRDICENDNYAYSGDKYDLVDGRLIWKVQMSCLISSKVEVKSVDGKEMIVFKEKKA